MFRIFRVAVEFPALDRLLDYLQAQQQAEVDALTQRVDAATTALAQSRARLDLSLKTNNSKEKTK